MANPFPVSRYLLIGIAALMLGAAMPDFESLFQRARQSRHYRSVRAIDSLPFR